MPSPTSVLEALHERALGVERPAGRDGVARRRLLLGLGSGLLVGCAALAAGASWGVALTGGWIAAALLFLVSVWSLVGRMDPVATEANACSEDSSRATADAVLVAAAVASLVAVGSVLLETGAAHGLVRGALIALAIAGVASAWATVHTVFMLRYARLYYTPPVGGMDFHGDEPPDYRDLAYVALTIGMTFQVSDTELTAKQMRRVAVHHALLSYLFGAVIIAITINIVGTLASGS
jgi:uncharacterized membrane protein